MKPLRRKVGLSLLGILMVISLSACQAAPVFNSRINLPQTALQYTKQMTEKPSEYIGTDGYMEPGFSTHLPVIMIEFLPDEPASAENDWYNSLEITVFDGGEANAVTDTPTATIPTKGRIMADQSSIERVKQDYYLRFYDDGGDLARHGLLGLAESSEFFLIGSMYDRSLLRNYLGYTLAAQIMADTPSVRFCEVVLNQGEDGYLYQGVYLLIENTRTADTVTFRRTTTEQGFALQTYGAENYPEDGRLEVPFFETIEDESALWETVGRLSHIEEVIYSDDLDTFSGYKDLIDVDSFVDYFIINEMLGNYTAKTDTFYRYAEAGGILMAGPVWNFERALDNEIDLPMDVDSIQFDVGGYYGQLIRSRAFLEKLKERYLELRENILNENTYNQLIDDAVKYLGPAIERNWNRWVYHGTDNAAMALQPTERETTNRNGEEQLLVFVREPQDSHWEIQRIRYLIREHDLQMAYDLAFLEADIGTELVGAEASYVRNTWLFVLFIAVLAVTIHYVRRHAE